MVTDVVFDFDGTLVDSRALVLRLYNDLAHRKGFVPLTPGNLEEMRGLSLLERSRRLGVSPFQVPGLVGEFLRNYREELSGLVFYEGMLELLRDLRDRGTRLSILSSNDEANIRDVLRRHGVEAWVEHIQGGSRLFGKARPLRALMRRRGLSREQLIYVGDERRDVEACKQVGVRILAVPWGFDSVPALREAGAELIVESPARLLAELSRVASPPRR
ncbi:MAG: HAD hydrolase-like protein [Cystobacter sp.]